VRIAFWPGQGRWRWMMFTTIRSGEAESGGASGWRGVIHQDLRDLTDLKDYTQLELLADLLPSKVGSLLSLNSIAEDLAKSPHTIANWIDILGSVYQCYLVAPYGPRRSRPTGSSRSSISGTGR
jgi:hypothetical protein